MIDVENSLQHGASFPFDCWDGDGECTATPATSWAHAAARGILANLSDRRGIDSALDNIDYDVRAEIVQSITEIILTAERTMRAPTAEGLDVVDGAGIIKGNEGIACDRGDAKPDLTTDTSPVYPKPLDLRGQYP